MPLGVIMPSFSGLASFYFIEISQVKNSRAEDFLVRPVSGAGGLASFYFTEISQIKNSSAKFTG